MHQEINYSLEIDVNAVLRGQGADPAIIRSRSPHLVEVARQALEQAKPFLNPRFLRKSIRVDSVRHGKIILENKISFSNSMLVNHLKAAEQIEVIICTLGPEIDQVVSRVMATDMLLGLAIDGAGSAGIETFANSICAEIEAEAFEKGLSTTIPLNPGMVGWPIQEGQPLLFEMLAADEIGVELTKHYLMIPRKTLSMLIGVGSKIAVEGSVCDYCMMKETCRYQDHYH